MASDNTVNLALSEFREEDETNEVNIVQNPRTLDRPLSSSAFETVNLGPGITEVSKYSKSIYSQGLINISLLSVNATQLRTAQSNNKYEHQIAVIGLISASIILQILILLLLSLLIMFPRIKSPTEEISPLWKLLFNSRIKSVILFLVSILTAINIFISVYQNM